MARESKQSQIAIAEAIHLLQTFRGADPAQTILREIAENGRLRKNVRRTMADYWAAFKEAANS